MRGTLPTRGDRKSPTASRKLATRPTRPRSAGIQTYPLTWVPTGHARALPLRPSRQRTPGIQTYPPGRHSAGTPTAEGLQGRIQSGIRKCCIFGFSAVFFPRRFTKPSRCERGTRRSGGKQAHLAPDLKSRSGTSQSNVAILSNPVKRNHTRPLLAEKACRGGHTIRCARQVCTAAVSPRLGDSPQVAWPLQSSRHRWRAPGGKTQWRGALREGNASPQHNE